MSTPGEESTQRVTAPQDFGFVDEIVELLSNEAEALLEPGAANGDPDALLADMNLRLALLAWDVSDDRDSAARYLEIAERHPLAPRMLLAHALASGSSDQLDNAQATIESLVSTSAERAATKRDLAEAWLYRFGDAARAIDCARDALSLAPSPELAADLHHTLLVSLALAEDWEGLAEALTQPPGGQIPVSGAALTEAAHILLDRLGDRDRAAEVIASVDKPAAEAAFHLAGLALEVAPGEPTTGGGDPGEALEQRIALLETDPQAAHEAAATRYLLVQHLAALGDVDAAVEALTSLAQAPADGGGASWAQRLVTITRYHLAVRQRNWTAAAELSRELADKPGGGRMAVSYRRRAAELLDARAANPAQALETWYQVFAASSDDQSSRAIERALVNTDGPGLMQHFENVARRDRRREPSALRRASAVAESRCRDLAGALKLRRAALAADGDAVARHDDLLRLSRQNGERAQLAELYRDMAATLGEEELASVYLSASGPRERGRGGAKKAEER